MDDRATPTLTSDRPGEDASRPADRGRPFEAPRGTGEGRAANRAAPMRISARRYLARVLILVDVFAAAGAALAAGAVRELLTVYGRAFSLEVLPTLLLVPLLVAGLALAGCYRPAGAGLGADTFRRYVRGTGFNVLLVGFTSFALRLNFSRLYVALLAAFLLVIGLVFRWVLRRMAQSPAYGLSTRVIVAGTDETSCHVAQTLDGDGPFAFHVLGYVCNSASECTDPEGQVLGDLADLPALVASMQPDAVLASAASLSGDELRELYLLLEPVATELVIYPSLVEVASRRLDVETVGPFPLLHLSTVQMTLDRRILKRTLDVVVATVALLLGLPVLLVSAIAVKIDSRGPLLFNQRRVGVRGKTFTLYKLRTMTADAEERLDELLGHNEAGDGLFKMRDDPRITRVGRLLRRFSIDEMPQFVNVLLGDMSLVGPRPALPDEVEQQISSAAIRRQRIKPGLTGYWQVSGRSEVNADEALRMDLYYVENWSLAFDLQIMLRTIKVVLASDGAY